MINIGYTLHEANDNHEQYRDGSTGWYRAGDISIRATIYPDGYYYLGRSVTDVSYEDITSILIEGYGVKKDIAEKIGEIWMSSADEDRAWLKAHGDEVAISIA